MEYLSDVVDSIKPILKNLNFKKKALNWIKETEKVYIIFNIQKSEYSKKVYLNAGFLIKEISPEEQILINKCQIQVRFDDLIGNIYLEFENESCSKDRVHAFVNLININPFGFFTNTGTKEELIHFIMKSKTNYVTIQAIKYLGINV